MGDTVAVVHVVVSMVCPECGRALALRQRRSDGASFLGCTGWRNRKNPCSFTHSLPSGATVSTTPVAVAGAVAVSGPPTIDAMDAPVARRAKPEGSAAIALPPVEKPRPARLFYFNELRDRVMILAYEVLREHLDTGLTTSGLMSEIARKLDVKCQDLHRIIPQLEVERRHGKLAKNGSGAAALWRIPKDRLEGVDDDALREAIVDEIMYGARSGGRPGVSEAHLCLRLMRRFWSDGFDEGRIRRLCLSLEHNGIITPSSPVAKSTWIIGNSGPDPELPPELPPEKDVPNTPAAEEP